MKTTKEIMQSTVSFSEDQLHEALFFVEDLFERVALQPVVLGDLAYCIVHSEPLNANKVIVGVRRLETNYSVLETLKDWAGQLAENVVESKGKIEFTYKGIPIIIKILSREYGFISNPDTLPTEAWHWKVPNNFDKYWKMRHLVN